MDQTRPSVNYAKDWLGQLFLFPGLVWSWKGFQLWMWSLGGSQQPFSCLLGHFWHGDNRTTNRVILEQAYFWPVRRQSFAKVKTLILRLCCSLKLVLTHTSLRQPEENCDNHHQLQWPPFNDNDNIFNNFKIIVVNKGSTKEITQEEER